MIEKTSQLLIAAVAMVLAGCQTTPGASADAAEASKAPASELVKPENDFSDAMMQPFTDFNITRDPIPAPLQEAVKAPYAAPEDPSCGAIVAETAHLDSALGPDLDVSETKDAAGNPVQSMAAGALRSLTTGWIPFRGILRRMTGAEAHAQAAREAILAGAVRRAYLKGLGERAGCAPPAAPSRTSSAP